MAATYDRERRTWSWSDGTVISEADISEADKRAIELWLCYPERGALAERLIRYAGRYEDSA